MAKIDIKKNLREARESRRYSVTQLAVESRSSKSYLWGIENKDGKVNISVNKLIDICQVLGVHPMQIIFGEGWQEVSFDRRKKK